MDIITIPFEKTFSLTVDGQHVKIVMFRTLEQGNIKFGIDAPRSLKVNREEVYLALLEEETLK